MTTTAPACGRCGTVLDRDGSCFTCGRRPPPERDGNGDGRRWRRVANEPPPPAADVPQNPDRAAPPASDRVGALDEIASRYTPVNWAEAWQRQPTAIDWLYEPVLEAGTVNALFAKPGTGKSLLALEIGLTLARAGRVVVYIDDENRLVDLVERLQAFGAAPGELGKLRLYSFAGLPALDTPIGGTHLLALACISGAALVILDTTTRMVAGRENDADTFLQLYRCSLVPLKARGITVLRLDHPGKDGERGQRGSSAKDGDVDTIWKLTEVTQGLEYRLHRDKSRSGHGGAEDLDLRRRYDPLRHEWAARESYPVDILCGQLDDLGVLPEAGRPTARKALSKAGIQASNVLLEAAIHKRKAAHGQARAAGQSSDKADRCPPAPHIGAGSGQAPAPGQDQETGQ